MYENKQKRFSLQSYGLIKLLSIVNYNDFSKLTIFADVFKSEQGRRLTNHLPLCSISKEQLIILLW